MSEFIIIITNGSNSGSVKPDIGFSYPLNLNEINEAELRFSSLNTVTRTLITMGATVLITKDGVNVFYGYIDGRDNVTGGGISIHCSGHEVWLTKEPRVYSASPWLSTASATIASAIIAESTHLSAGTIESGLSIDLRVEKSDTLWNALGMICKKTAQDVSIDYSNVASVKVSVLNHKGSSTSTMILNNNFEITNPRYSQGYPSGNSVEVLGKGDGVNQIKSTSAYGQDATSIAAYGTIYRPVVNRNVMTVAEANQLADKEVVLTKDPTEIYTFTVKDVTLDINSGDIITINAEDLGISSTDVRVTQVRRGIDKQSEFLEIQVANANYGKILKLRDRYLSDITRQSIQESTQMMGSGNTLTYGNALNAKLNYPLIVPVQLPTAFIVDEAGVIRVDSFTVDYDVDPYKKGVGTASYTGSDPQVQNSSANTQPTVTGTVDVNSNLGVTDYYFGGYGSGISKDSFFTLHTENSVTGSMTLFTFTLHPDTDLNDFYFRIKDESTGTYYPNSTGLFFTNAWATDFIVFNIMVSDNISSHNLSIQYKATTGFDFYVFMQAFGTHDHTDGSLTASNHLHADGTYSVLATDINNISIGDDVSDAASVNATQVSLYVDFWNGSTWVNKHSILNTGKTLDTNVDVSNGGTLPDAAGYWRVRINPSSSSADFVQGIVKVKHSLDS